MKENEEFGKFSKLNSNLSDEKNNMQNKAKHDNILI